MSNISPKLPLALASDILIDWPITLLIRDSYRGSGNDNNEIIRLSLLDCRELVGIFRMFSSLKRSLSSVLMYSSAGILLPRKAKYGLCRSCLGKNEPLALYGNGRSEF